MKAPYKVATLIFLQDIEGKHLLLNRNKSPNSGMWSPIGGKLDMETGESPTECAVRETFEETACKISADQLHLFGVVSEKSYEGKGHWLLFLFKCLKPLDYLPKPIDEGFFGFFNRTEIQDLNIPTTDREGLWPLYDEFNGGFSCMRIDCTPGNKMEIIVEQSLDISPLKTRF